MTAIVTRGDAANLQLPDATVDLIVTSPPYFGLRSYQDGGAHYAGQVGDEATPTEYLDALIACTAEWMRVLKPGGSIFVNLGDKYATAGTRQGNGDGIGDYDSERTKRAKHYSPKPVGFPTKSLMLLPQRYAIRCIDELGLILRAEIVWAKPNGLPESVTDRVRRSHEQVFHFVKQPRYFSAVDEVREEHIWGSGRGNPSGKYSVGSGRNDAETHGSGGFLSLNPLGKLPGSVWTIPTAPLTVPDHLGIDHFAAYPPELVRRIVLGWSPREVCTVCGEGRRPVVTKEAMGRPGRDPSVQRLHAAGGSHEARRESGDFDRQQERAAWREGVVATVTGYACACPDTTAPSIPGVCLDPFGGTGTTALVASVFGRVGISVDLSADYCRLARWRTTDPGERARALGVDKPPPQVDGQLGMFEGIGA